MRIMICDDDKREREELAGCVRAVWPDAETEEVEDAKQALEFLQKHHHYDLVFLDIYLGELDGIRIGRRIRSSFPEISLVFVSNSREFGPEVFELNALHYLVKPCSKAGMEEVKRRYEARAERNAVVRVSTRGKPENIPIRNITYIESEHNNLQIHLANGSVLTIRDSLQNYMEKLDGRFLRINRGVIINMDAVEKMNTDSCEIAGKIFMLSRKNRRESRKKYNDYIFEIAIKAM